MRRSLNLLVGSVTAMVVLAFLVPLFILVGDLARDRALAAGERDAESLARVLSVLSIQEDLTTAVEAIGSERIEFVQGSVIMPDGTVVGLPVPPDEDLSLAQAGSSFIAPVEGGQAVYIPVIDEDGEAAVVRVFVSDEEMTSGVRASWFILGSLGLLLVLLAVWIADRLGRSLVVPVKDLSRVAHRLGQGELTARVTPSGPAEIEEVGLELNRLADRIVRLLQAERETAADLAHRLRTPLTAARLSVEGLAPGQNRDRLDADLDELQRTTDFIITEARRPVRRESEEWCDLGDVVRGRSAFWRPLVEEQGREMEVSSSAGAARVALPRGDAEAMVDAMIENVLSHTPDGVRFAMDVTVRASDVVLTVEDAGPGYADPSVIDRGASTGESTGLGLDIVRRTVEGAGGSVTFGESQALGGAGIVVVFPLQ